MTKVLFLSDVHNEFERLYYEDPPECDIVVLAGDIHLGMKGVIWAVETFGATMPIVYVMGNHEGYTCQHPNYMRDIKDAASLFGVHLLDRSSVTIKGLTFHGVTLWTDFNDGSVRSLQLAAECMSDYSATYNFSPYDALRYNDDARAWIECLGHCPNDIMVTHHAPCRPPDEMIPIQFRIMPAASFNYLYFNNNMDGLIKKFAPKLWFHGHVHYSLDYFKDNTRILTNPRGYVHHDRENHAFNPYLILDL